MRPTLSDKSPRDLYIDLLKKSLSFSLWPEPGIALDQSYSIDRFPFFKRQMVKVLMRILRASSLTLVTYRDMPQERREEGRHYWPRLAHTMIGMKRLDNIQFCVEQIIQDDIPGDLIETGVWRGGACILMRGILAAYDVDDKRVFLADSFKGLPKPDATQYPDDKDDRHHRYTYLAVSREEVEENFRQYGLLDEQVVFLEGWFKDTLPTAPIEKLAVLRLDGDMYQSTIEALTHLYPKLQPGGFCIVDDYAIPGCRKAVEDYREAHHIDDPIQTIDYTGVYWRKT